MRATAFTSSPKTSSTFTFCITARGGGGGGYPRIARENSSSLYGYAGKISKSNERQTQRGRNKARYAPLTTRAEQREGNNSPYHTQNEEKLMDLLTVQSVKTVLHYLQETNGEMHLFLNNYIAEHPFGQIRKNAAGQPKRESGEEWLIKLASSGLTTVTDVNRGSVPTIDDSQPKTREVSPRDCAERILATRKDLGEDFVSFLEKVEVKNGSVLRNALERTFTTVEEEE
ncbi:unnamed protein product [Bathycoccus prasinos]